MLSHCCCCRGRHPCPCCWNAWEAHHRPAADPCRPQAAAAAGEACRRAWWQWATPEGPQQCQALRAGHLVHHPVARSRRLVGRHPCHPQAREAHPSGTDPRCCLARLAAGGGAQAHHCPREGVGPAASSWGCRKEGALACRQAGPAPAAAGGAGTAGLGRPVGWVLLRRPVVPLVPVRLLSSRLRLWGGWAPAAGCWACHQPAGPGEAPQRLENCCQAGERCLLAGLWTSQAGDLWAQRAVLGQTGLP